jgi:hypothetical protein
VQKPSIQEATNKKRSNENETSTSRSSGGDELAGYEFEREYVLVGSKQTVEVNALADGMNRFLFYIKPIKGYY